MAGIIYDRFFFGEDDLIDLINHNIGLFTGMTYISFENTNLNDKITLEENSMIEINGDLFVFEKTDVEVLGTKFTIPYLVYAINNQDGTASLLAAPRSSFVFEWDAEKKGYYASHPDYKAILAFYPVNTSTEFYANQVIIDKEIFWDE